MATTTFRSGRLHHLRPTGSTLGCSAAHRFPAKPSASSLGAVGAEISSRASPVHAERTTKEHLLRISTTVIASHSRSGVVRR
jgi:hypothetical protein